MMKRLELRDTIEFRRGRRWEQECARQMLERGHHVIRCYDLDVGGLHKAPIAEGPYAGYRLPDLQVLTPQGLQWVECKEKSRASYTHTEYREDHGIGLRCYRDYRTVQRLSKCQVWLALAEYDTGLILLKKLSTLGNPREYHGSKMDPGGMAFWPREAFLPPWGRFNKGDGQAQLRFGRGPFTGFDGLAEAAE
jgi:hypothetical protein